MVKVKSRTRNAVNNTIWSAMFYILKMVLQFIVRALFIRYLGGEMLGLNGLFTNVLNLLSLAELGIGNAIVYSMYKPIAEGDIEKTKALLRIYRNVYLVIGIVVTLVGLSIIPALPFFIKDAPDTIYNINILYLIYLAHNVVGYFFAYRRSLVFAAQRNDIESKVGIIAQIIVAVMQIVAMVSLKNYYYYACALVIGSVIDAICVFAISFKLFPELKGKPNKLEKSDKQIIVKNSAAKFVQSVGWNAVFSTDSLIVSSFLGLGLLGVYSNYTMIMTALISVINLFCLAVQGSVGNLISSEDSNKVYKVFKSLDLALYWLIGVIFIGLVCCYQDFMILFAGSEEYLLDYVTVILICLQFFFRVSKYMIETFKDCAGLFWNDWFRPLIEAGLNLALDFLFLYFMGINGIILATIISTILVSLIIEPYVVYKNLFKKKLGWYYVRYLVYSLVIFVACAITYSICYFVPSGGGGWFVLKFVICLIIPPSIFLLASFKTPEFCYLCKSVKNMFAKKNNSKVSTTERNIIPNDVLKKLQSTELEIMKDIDRFCKENDIKYSLFAGTALGAIRHGGFIPWDDDIDICMTRTEYERFMKLWSEKPIDGYYLQGTGENDITTINHAKVRKLNTVYADYDEYKADKEHQGMWVDIFPFDKVPNKKSLQKKVLRKAKLMMLYTRGYPIKRKGKLIEIASRILLAIPKSTQKKIKIKCEKYIRKFSDMSTDFCYRAFVSMTDFGIEYPSDLMDDFESVEFEDTKLSITTQYDVMLSTEFGDYMQLPPEEDRVPVHSPDLIIFDAVQEISK